MQNVSIVDFYDLFVYSKAREELKKERGVEYSYPVLAFHGTAVANIQPICETGFKVPG